MNTAKKENVKIVTNDNKYTVANNDKVIDAMNKMCAKYDKMLRNLAK